LGLSDQSKRPGHHGVAVLCDPVDPLEVTLAAPDPAVVLVDGLGGHHHAPAGAVDVGVPVGPVFVDDGGESLLPFGERSVGLPLFLVGWLHTGDLFCQFAGIGDRDRQEAFDLPVHVVPDACGVLEGGDSGGECQFGGPRVTQFEQRCAALADGWELVHADNPMVECDALEHGVPVGAVEEEDVAVHAAVSVVEPFAEGDDEELGASVGGLASGGEVGVVPDGDDGFTQDGEVLGLVVGESATVDADERSVVGPDRCVPAVSEACVGEVRQRHVFDGVVQSGGDECVVAVSGDVLECEGDASLSGLAERCACFHD
jgi:hypothetical protein